MEGTLRVVEIILLSLFGGSILIAIPYLAERLESLYRRHLINFFSSKHSIAREQYFSHAGYEHIMYYLSFYPDPFPEPSASFVDDYPTSRKPTYEEVKSWEASNGPQTFEEGLKEFVVEEGIRKIGVRAFGYNLNLYSIKFPSTLERIASEAFIGCKSLHSIELPENIRSIGKEAFDRHLQELRIFAKRPPKITNLGIDSDCRIFIPAELEKLYKSSRRWRKYSQQMHHMLL